MARKRLAFSPLAALRHKGSIVAACLTCFSQPQFYTELFWDMTFYSSGWAAALFLLCCRATFVDNRLTWLSDGALRWVDWNFGRWKGQYMCTYPVHALVKSGAVQQHPFWRTYCACTVVTYRPIINYTGNMHLHTKYVIRVKFIALTVTDYLLCY